MDLVSKAEFAKRLTVSGAYVYKICKAEKLTMVDDGKSKKPKIDMHGAATIEFLKEREEQQLEKNGPPTQEQKPDPEPDQSKVTYLEPKNKSSITEKKQLEIEKLEEGNEKLRIDNEKKRGALIPKILIKRVFARLYSIFENQLKALGINISPKISALYNEANQTKTIEILELIDKTDDKILKSEINKILESGEPDRIIDMNSIIEDSVMTIIKAIQREFEKFLKNIKKLGE